MHIIHIPIQKTGLFKKELTSCIGIRKEVFIKEQSVDYSIEQDGKDEISSHLLLIKEDTPIATLRMRNTEEGIKLERIAVLKEYRGTGIGKHLVTHAMNILQQEDPHTPIYVHSQQHATHFYSSLGFVATDESTIEAGIVHLTMIYRR